MLDDTDRLIINTFQDGFPVSVRPYADAAARIHIEENELIARISSLLEKGVLTRFGPLFNADMMGGMFCLCAMQVPEARFDGVAAAVNVRVEVAHNYERDHPFNMWFVLAVESVRDIDRICSEIEKETGLPVFAFPKLQEFFINFRVQA